MSAASCLLYEDHFLCSICLDVFTDPVSTPCGHNFCKTCITQHWNVNAEYVCPLCNEVFYTRPEMKVNTFISEMASEVIQATKTKASSRSEQPAAKPGEVQCDVCTGNKVKAIKSCLKCEASYCQTHLEPHLTAPRLKSHQLIHPVDNLEDRMCKKHDKPLELFCKTDKMCLCMLCTVLDHKNHEFVPLKEEYEGKKAELGRTEAEIQQKILRRRLKIQEIEQSAKLSREAADREKAVGVQVFTALKQRVEKSQADFIENMEEKLKSTEKQAEDFIKELQQEISELTKKAAEVEKLSRSEDHLKLLQSFPSISTVPPTKDWTQVRVHQRSYEGSVVRAVAQLEETISEDVKKLLEVELKRIKQFAVDVTLNRDTVYYCSILRENEKQDGDHSVMRGLRLRMFLMFYLERCVLGKQSFSSGRFYYEVQVKGKTKWGLGVTRESSNRGGRITLCPKEGYWAVTFRNENKFSALDDPRVPLSIKSKPERVGVFVHYEEGLVSFYDVDAAALIFSFTGCSFTDKLLPFFGPWRVDDGENSATKIIPAKGGAKADTKCVRVQAELQEEEEEQHEGRKEISERHTPETKHKVSQSPSRAAVHTTKGEEKRVDQKFVHSTAESQPNPVCRYVCCQHFLCPICLEVFTDPVSTPCGHNFCKTCITQHWNVNAEYVCPLCNEVFYTRPEMRVNTFISEMASEVIRAAKTKASSRSEQPAAKPGEVQCDVCTGTKVKAIKSCLKCEASYCQTHLEPHLTAPHLKSHQLIHPVDNLEDRMCKKHDKPLEVFCKTDQMCLCTLCAVLDHKNHEFVPLKEEYEGKKAELGRTEAEIQQNILQRRLKIQEIEQSAKLSRKASDREKADGVQVFTALKQRVEKSQADFIENMEEKLKSTEKQAEDFIKELQQEISELTKKAAEVDKLSRSEDHLELLQSFPSTSTVPPTKDWTQVRVHQRSYEGSVVRAVAQLEETISKDVKKLLEVELKRIQQFAVDVTLDPDTAYICSIPPDDEKQGGDHSVMRRFRLHMIHMFSLERCVLGKQSFSSGRFYYEVQVKGKTKWGLGVTRESSNRWERITLSPKEGYWTVTLRNGNKFSALDDPRVPLSVKSKPENVGVFVHYEEGLVSFYDVDAAALIFSFTGCSFTDKLLPFFGPWRDDDGENSATKVIPAK